MENKMNVTKLAIGTVVGFIVAFGFGGIWHMALFSNYYYHNPEITIQRAEPMLGYIAIGELLRSFVLAWLFLQLFPQGATVGKGIMLGIMAGLLAAGLWAFANYGVFMLPMNWVVMDTFFVLIQTALNGLVLALLNRKK
jgi:hypothetical protein